MMETYDILFKDSREVVEKGFNIRDKEKAIRMAVDMLAGRKGLVEQFLGGTISVVVKQTREEIWSRPIPNV